MTVENVSLSSDDGSASLTYSSTYFTVLHNGVCAFAPNASNVFMTVDIHGSLANGGVNYPSSQEYALRADRTIIQLFGNGNSYAQEVAGRVANLLNNECSCNADIEVGGSAVTVYPGNCRPPLPDTYWLCWVMSGSPLRIEASQVSETSGTWEHSFFNDSLRHRDSPRTLHLGPFEQTTNNNQDLCDYDLWSTCEEMVKEAVRTCQYFIAYPWNDLCTIQVFGQSGLDKCCPCAVRFVQQCV